MPENSPLDKPYPSDPGVRATTTATRVAEQVGVPGTNGYPASTPSVIDTPDRPSNSPRAREGDTTFVTP